ncbi:DUF924 family protein [Novosphingobium sp. JCM 18896]|uniref:DUF924 family protein n=1 Tax=Novosphingobium sp. JCM 18896 TaxID=2989731 RepID=UPI002222B784|nr:DUF924 family protein [Novosphingobium sp. JCM 18896]MCW1429016.1 DUF924 domain-containing protein [Novosphingobium sp. JCM 18896]
MTAARLPWAADLLHAWFHELRPDQWFGRSDVVDTKLRRRFARTLARLGGQPATAFLGDPLTARAAVLLFDQVPRNLFRDDPRAFAYDSLARAITRGARAKGWDRSMTKNARHFLYMPMMHSEAIADQLLALRLFAALGNNRTLDFCRSHARMIERFGRFPHRNKVLGRKSTRAEKRAVAEGNAW